MNIRVPALSALCLAMTVGTLDARALRLGHASTETNPRHEAAVFFAAKVAELSGGALTVSIASNAQLGDDGEMMTALRLGTLDMSISSQGAMAGIVEEATLVGLPFLFRDTQTAWAVLDGAVGDSLSASAEAKGVKVLGYWDNGIRLITNSKHPVTKPEDMRGLKIRIPSDPMANDIFSALGANPVPIPFAETYVALQQGVADGQENPAVNIHSQKFHEVQPHLALSYHKYEFLPFLASKITWAQLSEDEQRILSEAAQETTAFQRESAEAANAALLEEIRASGTQFTEVDYEAFFEAVAPVYEKWRASHGGFVEQLVSAAQGEAG